MNNEIFESVKEVIIAQLEVDAEKVKMESSLVQDLGADSLDLVEVIMALEEKFELEIEDEDAEKIATVEDIIKYIESRK